MSYTDIHHVVGHRADCDACGLYTQTVRQENLPARVSGRHFRQVLIREGWTFWAGRSLRVYCPSCKPRPGHKMRDVTERWA